MKQTMKRIYGTLALVAFVSGVTGAVTFSFLHNRFANADNDPVVNGKLADSKDEDKKKDKYTRACEEFIYYMLINKDVIKAYDSSKLYFINSYRNL